MHDATHPLGLLLSLGLGGLLGLEELLQSILRQRLAVGIKPDLGHLLRGRLGGRCSFGHGAHGGWVDYRYLGKNEAHGARAREQAGIKMPRLTHNPIALRCLPVPQHEKGRALSV